VAFYIERPCCHWRSSRCVEWSDPTVVVSSLHRHSIYDLVDIKASTLATSNPTSHVLRRTRCCSSRACTLSNLARGRNRTISTAIGCCGTCWLLARVDRVVFGDRLFGSTTGCCTWLGNSSSVAHVLGNHRNNGSRIGQVRSVLGRTVGIEFGEQHLAIDRHFERPFSWSTRTIVLDFDRWKAFIKRLCHSISTSAVDRSGITCQSTSHVSASVQVKRER
jgi:hypothetical protein